VTLSREEQAEQASRPISRTVSGMTIDRKSDPFKDSLQSVGQKEGFEYVSMTGSS